MPFKYLYICFVLILSITAASKGQAFKPAERICGKWETTDKTLRVQIFMEGREYKVKLIWFSDTDGKPMAYWTDRRNPNPALRSRKILGMDLLRNLEYHPNTDSWENGMIYDSKHGKEWNAAAYIDKKGQLRVKGYWHIKLIGKTMTFTRI
ncbi:DUF2147 domain-containing protein [Mucilaginibacter sp. OK098]|uniref:DUF2147 domain-containing protein n=1 Tax=Mucilaginibacter sp. OK098 TaxID=1855297 RepID=UPI000921E09B|nr:DUF2147 domain-containing protein [Mucilaginibacter sp. OK098]SHN11152.1 Uncharacterized conserved protein, DUF2147 family [Mucilaginibacter sp. OK098]